MTLLKSIAHKIGLDGAIFFSILSKLVLALGSFLSILFIGKFLSIDEQGYYYTFGSIIAIQLLFELGLSSMITQYVAHETVHLNWSSKVELSGNKYHHSRLSSILHLTIKWFSIISIILFVVLLITGFIFFNKFNQNEYVSWQSPWILISLSTAISLLANAILSFLEGLGKIKEVAQIRFFQNLINMVVLLTSLSLHAKLFSLGIASLCSYSFIYLFLLTSKYKRILYTLFKNIDIWKIKYKEEVFSYHWRIALSWVSGYLVFQAFNPILFAISGPSEAGKMGMTLTILSGITALSSSWMNTKIPLYSNLISKKEYFTLDQIFYRTLKQVMGIQSIMTFLFLTFVYILSSYSLSFLNRILSFPALLFISTAYLCQPFIYSIAIYLRCHKKEPFLYLSIFGGVATVACTYVFGKLYHVQGITLAFLMINIISSIFAYKIFITKKRVYHYL